MTIEIIDSHQHFWHSALVPIPWLSAPAASFGDPSALKRIYTPADYRRDAGALNIVGTVHVEPGARPEDGMLETAWLTGLSDGGGLPSAVVAYADVTAPDLAAKLADLARSPLLRGVRMRLNFDEASGRRMTRSDHVMEDEDFRRGLRQVAAHGLVFNLSVFAPQLAMAARLATAMPEVTLVLEHVGWPIATDQDGFRAWRAGMAALADCANVFVKVSGFWAIDRAWRPEMIEPWAKETFALFGFRRCLFGSNLPIEQLMCPLPRQVDILSSFLDGASAGDRADFFAANARRVYRLPASGGDAR
ncbi:MAG TPA: amidohydrolase family protein [Stellaceae bacterium]